MDRALQRVGVRNGRRLQMFGDAGPGRAPRSRCNESLDIRRLAHGTFRPMD